MISTKICYLLNTEGAFRALRQRNRKEGLQGPVGQYLAVIGEWVDPRVQRATGGGQASIKFEPPTALLL